MEPALQQAPVDGGTAECDEVADYFEAADPSPLRRYPAADFWLSCAAQRAAAGQPDDRPLPELVADARSAGTSWRRIGELLGITAEAAQAKFG